MKDHFKEEPRKPIRVFSDYEPSRSSQRIKEFWRKKKEHQLVEEVVSS